MPARESSTSKPFGSGVFVTLKVNNRLYVYSAFIVLSATGSGFSFGLRSSSSTLFRYYFHVFDYRIFTYLWSVFPAFEDLLWLTLSDVAEGFNICFVKPHFTSHFFFLLWTSPCVVVVITPCPKAKWHVCVCVFKSNDSLSVAFGDSDTIPSHTVHYFHSLGWALSNL